MDKAGEYAGQAREKVSEWAGSAGDAAKQASDKVQRWAGDAYHATSDAVGDFGQELTSLIRKHPLPAILVGFGVGLLLGRTADDLSQFDTVDCWKRRDPGFEPGSRAFAG